MGTAMSRGRSLIGVALLVAATSAARGEADPDARAEWLADLLRPGTLVACVAISECHRTVADWVNGEWQAIVDGQWTPVPPAAILRGRSIDGEPYVCSGSARRIACFVRPDPIM
jgi:hypothetical protein